MNRLKMNLEDRTSVCCNRLRKFMIRGERLIKHSYSWFSMKSILVDYEIFNKLKLSYCLNEED